MHEFVSMREWLAPPVEADVESAPPLEPLVSADGPGETPVPAADVSAVRRFHAALEDALTLATRELLREIACEVLGREIAHPCDVSNLVRRAIERYGVEPVRVHVHSRDLEAARDCGYAVVADESLRPGDALLVLECGSIDARLGTRLQHVLDGMPA